MTMISIPLVHVPRCKYFALRPAGHLIRAYVQNRQAEPNHETVAADDHLLRMESSCSAGPSTKTAR